MKTRRNCWEYKKCGREPGGIKAAELGICPAPIDVLANSLNGGNNGGRICWAIAGTFCDGKVQGTFAEKQISCMTCDFFKLVKDEEGIEKFKLLKSDREDKPQKHLKLSHPVYTLDNQLLLPKGALLSAETLETLVSLNRDSSQQTYSIMQHGSVEKDLHHFLSGPFYREIFSSSEEIAKIFYFMKNVFLVLPVLQSLDYFKRYDFYTYRHILLVFALSTLLAKNLVSDYYSQIQESTTGPTHDFGKICVPIPILQKTTPLARSERRILEHHTLAGYILLSYYLRDTFNLANIVARDHHERKDGSGYPRGIRQIDRMVEIVVVSDVYDALISPRPYRPVAYDKRTALEEITIMAERNKVSLEVVQALVANSRKDKPHYSECKVSKEKRGTPPAGNLYGIIAEEKESPPE